MNNDEQFPVEQWAVVKVFCCYCNRDGTGYADLKFSKPTKDGRYPSLCRSCKRWGVELRNKWLNDGRI